jgi:nitrite reductase (NO-forming)
MVIYGEAATGTRPYTPANELRKDLWRIPLAAAAVLALVMSFVALQGGGGDGGTAVAIARGAKIDLNAAPAEDFEAADPALATAPAGTTHRITLHATEDQMEVAPGVTQEMWTFGGSVPGTPFRGKVGDTFEITLINDGKNPHSIDFHSSKVAWNDEMRTIGPGEQLVYRFEAKHAGAYMYHCGTAPAIHHIGNGMYGAMIIDPPDLPEVDKEYLFVQSELYTGETGEIGDYEKMLAGADDAVVFNGYVNQYLHRPIEVDPDDRVRAWVVDAGPSQEASFHIVGTIFDTAYKEGNYLLRPGGARGGSQSLDLQAAQGGFVEFTFDEPGQYPIVTHRFRDASRGALGLFQVGEGEAPAGAAH